MPPIQLTRAERVSLRKLSERPRQLDEIPADHQEKLINYALVRKQVLLLTITPLGQIEFLRQRYSDISISEPVRKALLPAFRRNQLPTNQWQNGS
jgi:hypothetical protein